MTPERAAAIRELEWVSDGVSADEVAMVDWLVWTAIDYGELFDRVLEAAWLSDGVTAHEMQILKHLFFLAMSDLGFALWLLGQPFLETVELLVPAQSDPVQALLLENGGVTDEWTPIVAMTWPVARFAPDQLRRLYDPAVVRVHTKIVELPQSGLTLMAVVRTEPGAGKTLALVESIVREVEGTMGRPLPLDYVGTLFSDAVAPGAIGINYGTGMVLEPRFDVADGSYDVGADPLLRRLLRLGCCGPGRLRLRREPSTGMKRFGIFVPQCCKRYSSSCQLPPSCSRWDWSRCWTGLQQRSTG